MSYLVLARKWRPQAFADMTGQEHVVRTIANAIAQDRVAHAFLFCGPRGVGKTTAARLLARALNCQKGPTAEPCGTCAACTEIAAGTSVDVAEIDGASNNGVEDVRQIRERVTYRPQRDRHKIYIIDEVHMLTTAAFNALLKTLEEPPPHVKFIFATTEPHKLPDTILSRCQRHNFRRIPAARMVERLSQICSAEGAKISERSLALIVRQSEGGMRDALSLLDMVFSACGNEPTEEAVAEALGAVDRTAVHDLCDALVRRDAKPLLARVEDLYVRGVDFKRLTEELALYLRHLLVARATNEAPAELADSEKKAVLALAQQTDATQLSRLFDLVHGAIWEVSRAAQPRLAFEVALLKGVHLAPSASVSELLAKVESLAKKVGTSLPGSAPVAEGGRPGQGPFPAPLSAPAAEARTSPEKKNEVSVAGSLKSTPMSRYAAAADAPKVFPEEAPPAGCASQECLPPKEEAPAAPAPIAAKPAAVAPPAAPVQVPAAADAQLENPTQVWKQLVHEFKAKKRELLAGAINGGRLLSLTKNLARVGYSPNELMFRRQAEKSRAEIEEALTRLVGSKVVVQFEAVSESEGVQSLAQQDIQRERARGNRIERSSRENPAVLAAMRILGGTIERIDVKPQEDVEGFVASPDEGGEDA